MKDERKKYMRGSGIFDSAMQNEAMAKKNKKRPAPRRGRGGRAMGGKMYAHGGMTHSGAQPTYGSTVADAMPKGTAN